ncbi:hypothetical protein Csa_023924, partial [Cucumis sativus]
GYFANFVNFFSDSITIIFALYQMQKFTTRKEVSFDAQNRWEINKKVSKKDLSTHKRTSGLESDKMCREWIFRRTRLQRRKMCVRSPNA